MQGARCRIQGAELPGSRVRDKGDKGLRFRDKGFGFTMRIMGSRVQRFRFGVSGFRV